MSTDLTPHVCDSGWFDRSICPPPCGAMHSYCDTCGKRQDPCAHDDPTSPLDHDFLPVAGHPDDDECTHRADGTDATYCARPAGAHLDPTPMSTDETREALAAMVREGEAAGMYADDHGAAGFCTDHYNGPWHYSVTAARPATVAEAVEAGAGALAQEASALGVDLRAFDGDEKRLTAAVLEAVGYADLMAETPQPAPDERVETVARVLREHCGASFAENPDDASQWAWRCSGCAAVLFGSSAAPKVGNVPGVQFLTVALAAHQAAAVVAALDPETARLRYVENALAHCRSAGASYRSERDAARAALDRVRAETAMVRGYAALDFATAAGVVLLLDKFAETVADTPTEGGAR